MFSAKYDGVCARCGYAFDRGTQVVKGKAKGEYMHVNEQVCEWEKDAHEYEAEQAAELRLEAGHAAHMYGTAYVYREGGFDDL